jgi:hypothetical protein
LKPQQSGDFYRCTSPLCCRLDDVTLSGAFIHVQGWLNAFNFSPFNKTAALRASVCLLPEYEYLQWQPCLLLGFIVS